MTGNRVRLHLVDGETFEGVLVQADGNSGVIVHCTQGLADDRRFYPYTQIKFIQDLGRAP